MMRSATASRPLDQSERAKRRKWVRNVKDRIRLARRGRNDTHLVRGDDDLCEAIVDFSSIAVDGWTWPAEERLARALNEGDRNIRKRIARLQAVKLLIVIPPSDGWRSNRYVPVLDGRPLFQVALTSQWVREAIGALGKDGRDTGTQVPPQGATEAETAVPPGEERGFRSGRNARSTESSRKNPQEGSSPTPNPAPTAAPGVPRREEGSLDLNLQEASSTARPEPASTPGTSATSTEKPTPPNGCPTEDEPGVRAEPDRAEQPVAPVIELSFEVLMRAYPHPARGPEHEAYVPHALGKWGKLTPAQKHIAVRAAPNAPGKRWLGHWLDNGRETGKFEVIEQRPVIPVVWVRKDTPQWAAWEKHNGGRRPPTTQHRVDGELQTGWWFASEWPPCLENTELVGGRQ